MRTRLAVAALALTAPLLVAAPAQAGIFGGLTIIHVAPDHGYDPPIIVRCDGRTRTVPEGRSSDDVCKDDDVKKVYVRRGEQWRCQSRGFSRWSLGWPVVYDRTGWHDHGNDRRCFAEVD